MQFCSWSPPWSLARHAAFSIRELEVKSLLNSTKGRDCRDFCSLSVKQLKQLPRALAVNRKIVAFVSCHFFTFFAHNMRLIRLTMNRLPISYNHAIGKFETERLPETVQGVENAFNKYILKLSAGLRALTKDIPRAGSLKNISVEDIDNRISNFVDLCEPMARAALKVDIQNILIREGVIGNRHLVVLPGERLHLDKTLDFTPRGLTQRQTVNEDIASCEQWAHGVLLCKLGDNLNLADIWKRDLRKWKDSEVLDYDNALFVPTVPFGSDEQAPEVLLPCSLIDNPRSGNYILKAFGPSDKIRDFLRRNKVALSLHMEVPEYDHNRARFVPN